MSRSLSLSPGKYVLSVILSLTVVFMTDLSEFSNMNEIYAAYFKASPPGRTTVEVKSPPAGARMEITADALA